MNILNIEIYHFKTGGILMSEPLNLHRLTTESRNSQTVEIHKANTLGILKMINNEDMKVGYDRSGGSPRHQNSCRLRI